ncbi:MAG: TlpA family protein disulfide reductase [Chlorobi bacterium]|nr:TlpA family protein disulfide reductase [Chlorobiota bacterium]
MKKILFLLIINTIIFNVLFSQENNNKLPSVDIKTLTGETFNTSNISNDGPIFISFWATWCKPCIKELIAINENYADWQEETGLKVYAISIDDTKSMSRVAPFVNGRAWEFDVLLDTNSDFKRAMNVNNVPHSFILDKTGKVVWQHTSYSPGDEDEIYEIIKKVSAGENFNHN